MSTGTGHVAVMVVGLVVVMATYGPGVGVLWKDAGAAAALAAIVAPLIGLALRAGGPRRGGPRAGGRPWTAGGGDDARSSPSPGSVDVHALRVEDLARHPEGHRQAVP